MTDTTTGPWTQEDRETCIEALLASWNLLGWHGAADPADVAHDDTLVVFNALAPRVAKLQRAAKVEILQEAAAEFAQLPWVQASLLGRARQLERGEA